MMKKVGYRPHVAGAIEAAASTGGQLMPPIMGAGAFLMAEFTNTSYLTIIKVALVPAILYYVTVLFFVHFEAKKYGLEGQPKENLPKGGQRSSKRGCISSFPFDSHLCAGQQLLAHDGRFRCGDQYGGGQPDRQHHPMESWLPRSDGERTNTASAAGFIKKETKALSRRWKRAPRAPSWCRWPVRPPASSSAWSPSPAWD
jgi:hypothetical protein